ncbi:nucleotidyltransferase family protein [Flavisphingomonas formosensis]|uniref:nucleotidyltransferase family protein n=1 Tax=Flavisphingomonas formosensis TaxID=861534 RepID=UPI0012FC6414|nr:nucleotidyltransferase family protein [Sphingomonas formosensis]
MAGGLDAFLPSFGLPSRAESRILRACLSDDPAARQAAVDSLLAELTAPDEGRRWMLPLLADRLEAEGRLNGPAGIKLRAAALHEAGRSATFDAITAELAGAMDRAGCPMLLSRGHALALTAYARSGLRHRHDLDLLVPPESHGAARSALEGAGLRQALPPRCPAAVAFEHGSGLRVLLHGAPLPCTDSNLDLDYLRAQAVSVSVGGADVLVPDATALLLHCLLLAACHPPRGTAWAADAAIAIRAGGVDWNAVASLRGPDVVDIVGRLAWLSEVTGVAVPEMVLSRLRESVCSLDRAGRMAALERARRRGGMRAMIRASTDFGVRGSLLRWGLGQMLSRQTTPRREKAKIGRQ